MADQLKSIDVLGALQAFRDSRKMRVESDAREALAEAGSTIQAGGDVRDAASGLLASGGSVQDFGVLNNVANQDRNFDFRQSNARRQQGNFDARFDFQKEQAGVLNKFRQSQARRAQDNADREHDLRIQQMKEARRVRDAQGTESKRRFGITTDLQKSKIKATVDAARIKASAAGIKPSPGQKKLDEKFAATYNEWVPEGGRTDFNKQLDQLEKAATDLEKGTGVLTGPIVGSVPDFIGAGINPAAIRTREAVEEVVQRNLRLVLGPQFTEKEGERLIARSFNPRLSEAENARRVRNLLNQMERAKRSRDSASAYFEQNGTLKGWSGRLPRMSDFNPAKGSGRSTPRRLKFNPQTGAIE